MSKRRSLVVGLVVLALLGASASAALASDGCKKQNAHLRNVGESIVDEEVCDGYETCQFGEVKGTLNGSLGLHRALDWVEFVAEDTAVVIWADTKIETNKGEVWAQARCVVHLAAPGLACHMAVWGGTGDYVDATGWLGMTPIKAVFGTATGGTYLLKGEICPAEE
jgi:hypothetical protein